MFNLQNTYSNLGVINGGLVLITLYLYLVLSFSNAAYSCCSLDNIIIPTAVQVANGYVIQNTQQIIRMVLNIFTYISSKFFRFILVQKH